jgi:hypothetical protein
LSPNWNASVSNAAPLVAWSFALHQSAGEPDQQGGEERAAGRDSKAARARRLRRGSKTVHHGSRVRPWSK